MNEVTTPELETFRSALEAKVQEHSRANFPHLVGDLLPRIEIMQGKRYARIVLVSAGSRGAYGFIDMTNGDLLKTASWASPAKHARGNLRSADPLSCCGPYGMAYMR